MDTSKTFVPVLVFEDAPVHKSSEFRKAVNFPRVEIASGQEYVFDWHPVYNALGGFESDEPVLMRPVENYRNAVSFLKSDLRGPAILFLDMHYVDGSTLFPLDDKDVTENILRFVNCYVGETHDASSAHTYLNPERLGFTLAVAASENSSWEGVIAFASKRVDIDVDKVQQCFYENTNILWRNLGFTLASEGAALEVKARAVHQAINAFLERKKGPPFWPEYTNGWFKDRNSIPPHDPPIGDSSYESVLLIRKYLSELLPDFNPPKRWFENEEWKGLYEALKGLIGFYSVSAGAKTLKKNLRLGTIPLLLAAQMSWKKENIDWFNSYVWDSRIDKVEIMEHTEIHEAQNAIRAMAVFLEHLSVGKDGDTQVRGANCSPTSLTDPQVHLWLDFDLDPLARSAGKGLLSTIFGAPWGAAKGQTVLAYEQMMKSSQRRDSSTPPSFSLCIYPISHDNGVITRLDFCQVETG